MSTQSDLLFAKLAVLNRFVSQERVDEGLKVLDSAAALGLPLTVAEVLVKKQYMTEDQAASITRLRDYLQVRKEDVRLGELAAAARMVSEAQISECLSVQEGIFKRKQPYPRLGDLLLERHLLTPEALTALRKEQERLQAAIDRRGGAPPARAAAAAAGGAGAKPAAAAAANPAAGAAEIPTAEVHATPAGKGGARKAAGKGGKPAKGARATEVPRPAETQVVPLPLEELPAGLERSVSVTGFKADMRPVRIIPGQPGMQPKTIIVMDADGALDGYTFPFFEDHLQQVQDQEFNFLVINCRRLNYLSSAGIGVLISIAKEVRERGGDLRLCEVQDRIRTVIEMIGSDVIRIFESEGAAVSSFKYL